MGCCLALYPKFTWKQTFLLYSETLLLEYCWMYTSWTNTLNKFVLGQRFVFQGWMSTTNKVSVTMDVSQVFDILNVRIVGSWDQNEENKNIDYEIIHNLKILNLRTITYIACIKYLIVYKCLAHWRLYLNCIFKVLQKYEKILLWNEKEWMNIHVPMCTCIYHVHVHTMCTYIHVY